MVTYGPVPAYCDSHDLEVHIYPNPVQDGIMACEIYSDTEENIKAEIFNVLGEKIYSNIFFVKKGNTSF